MSEPPDLVVVADDGSIRPVGSEAAGRLRELRGRYRLIADAPGMLIVRAEEPQANGASRIMMAGEIISRTTVLEIINIVCNSGWRGELRVVSPDAARALTFDQGALKHARSNHPDDRLGEVLYRMGTVSRTQLEELLREVSPDRRFGQLLIDRGVVDREQLFQCLQKQIELIFHAALLVHSGVYLFGSPDPAAPAPSTTVHVPATALLMEGVQRIDEMALFRERIPNAGMCPEVQTGAPPPKQLDQNMQLVLAYSDGTRSIADISRETGLGDFETTKSVYYLMQQKQVVLRAAPLVDDDAVRSLVMQFNDVLRDIFVAVATYGGLDQTQKTIATWLASSGYAPLFGDRVEEDGSIDATRVILSLYAAHTERPLEALHQALHELAAFALFAATGSLPRTQELILSRDVNRRLKAIHI